MNGKSMGAVAVALLALVTSPVRAAETVELELNLNGVYGWNTFRPKARNDARDRLEAKLIAKLGKPEMLPAWKFQAGGNGATRLMIDFQATNTQGSPENAGLLVRFTLVLSPSVELALLPNNVLLELWPAGNGDWGSAYARGVEEAAKFLELKLLDLLDTKSPDIRARFCLKVPVAKAAGYHALTKRGWIAFWHDTYKSSQFEIHWKIPNKGLVKLPVKGSGDTFRDQGIVGLVVMSPKVTTLQTAQNSTVLLNSLDPTDGAEEAP